MSFCKHVQSADSRVHLLRNRQLFHMKNLFFIIINAIRKCTEHLTFTNIDERDFSLNFLFSKNPPAKYYRKQMSKNLFDLQNSKAFSYYNRYLYDMFDSSRTEPFFSCWSFSFIPANIRSFLLKKANNRLILNAELYYVNNNISQHCTFFTISSHPNCTLEKENYMHLFCECPHTRNILEKYFSNYCGDIGSIKTIMFRGHKASNFFESTYINIELGILAYFIFQSRNAKKIPTFNSIFSSLCYTKKTMEQSSKFYSHILKVLLEKGKNELIKNCITELRRIY